MTESSQLQQFAEYLKKALASAGYSYEAGRRTGDLSRLAEATEQAAARLGGNFTALGVDSLGRLLRGERMPRPSTLYPLAEALGVDYRELMAAAGILPARVLGPVVAQQAPFRPTPDQVADAWGITDDAGRALVRAMFERLASTSEADDTHRQ